ncbi:hypothetical protein [Nocardia sp. NPDC020380]|uniref:hypothetical protein n=1 Tax=Nocardia sp. NPDC020380 TaxID=3364309 RepID=UPI00378A7267
MTKKRGNSKPERRIIVEGIQREAPDLHKLVRAILTQARHDNERNNRNHTSPRSNNTSGDSNPHDDGFPSSEPPKA